MKPYKVLGIAALSFVIGAFMGLWGGWAALVGAMVFSFAILFAVFYTLELKKKRKAQEAALKSGARPDPNEVVGFDPKLETMPKGDDAAIEARMVDAYMREFNITRDKAQNLFDAGYHRFGDFSEAIPEDLVQVKGMNPTTARRIISTVRSKV